MGIYDREYYRREGPGFLGGLFERGTVCKWLIALNVACFLLQLATKTLVRDEFGRQFWKEPFTDALNLDVKLVLEGQVWRVLTYAFLHSTSDILHIVFNMLFLWWFGRQMEEDLGSREFLAFYLLGAVVSGVAFTLATLAGWHYGLAVGASGAIMAVTVLFACHYPRNVIYLFFVLPIPVWLFVVGMVLLDGFSLLGAASNRSPDSRIAWSAHLGGAAFGFVYYKLQLRLTGWLSSGWPARSWRRRRAPSLHIYREDDPTPVGVAAPAPPAQMSDLEALKAEVDLILEKISLVGKDNLTERERQVLMRASEALRRRR